MGEIPKTKSHFLKKITSVNTNINIQVYQDSGVAIDLSAATNVKVVKVG